MRGSLKGEVSRAWYLAALSQVKTNYGRRMRASAPGKTKTKLDGCDSRNIERRVIGMYRCMHRYVTVTGLLEVSPGSGSDVVSMYVSEHWVLRGNRKGEQWHGDARRRSLMEGVRGERAKRACTQALESENEIHAIGLYDKCRARHRVKGKPSSRSFPDAERDSTVRGM
ncbi:hypothetical protein EI94DRAFT_1718567 [Lactarius quietus]|nr:hypothetical protein EI94DRAFT_1718567 [Lactarius quietus]